MAGVPPPIKPPITPATPSSVPPPPEKLADAPFDNPRADLVLRSSDEVHFRVLKGILSIASTVFADMFGIPPPPSDHQDEIQVVPVSEDSTALDVVLRHLYPVRTPKGDILLYASILAEFARKYQVDVLDEFIPSYLKDSVERDPVGVYAIAAAYEYKSIGANAARLCLNLPFSGLHSPYLRCTTTELELLKYHVKCGGVTSAIASSSREWVSSLAQTGQTSKPIIVNRRAEACGPCGMQDVMPQTGHDIRFGPRCLWSYLCHAALILAQHPTAEIVTTESFILRSNDCPSCVRPIRADMLEVGAALRREINKAVSRVPLPKAVSE